MLARILATSLLIILTVSTAHGQDRRRRDGDRGDRGDRGGFGSSRGSFGSSWGGDRGRGGDDGRPRFDPAAMMDRNQNGVIDQEEIDRIPSFVQDRMKERGYSIAPGTSVDQYRKDFQRRMEERTAEYRAQEEARKNGVEETPNRTTPALPFKPRDKERITVDIPKEYSESDTDQDGQIGLYEWIISRRDDLELFDEMDRDSDGLLTPRELVAWDTLKAEAGKATPTSAERPKLVIVGGTAPSAPPTAEKSRWDRGRDRDSDNDENRDWRRGRRDRGDRGDSGDRDERRRQFMENVRNGKPPWGDGPPPWERGRR